MIRRGSLLAAWSLAGVLMLTSCGSAASPLADSDAVPTLEAPVPTLEEPVPAGAESVEELFPDVLGATASQSDDGAWTISVTLSSPYDSPERYADAWQVMGPDGAVYGERILGHDHASEQPFTRSQSGIKIPAEVATVTIQGRDQVSGWGGATFDLTLRDS